MARVRRYAPQVAGVPPEVADQHAPLWRDLEALEAHPSFGPFVDDRTRELVRMGGRGYHRIVSQWAVAHGFVSDLYPRSVDWHALRAAIGG